VGKQSRLTEEQRQIHEAADDEKPVWKRGKCGKKRSKRSKMAPHQHIGKAVVIPLACRREEKRRSSPVPTEVRHQNTKMRPLIGG
jgi:hypothetical protein